MGWSEGLISLQRCQICDGEWDEHLVDSQPAVHAPQREFFTLEMLIPDQAITLWQNQEIPDAAPKMPVPFAYAE